MLIFSDRTGKKYTNTRTPAPGLAPLFDTTSKTVSRFITYKIGFLCHGGYGQSGVYTVRAVHGTYMNILDKRNIPFATSNAVFRCSVRIFPEITRLDFGVKVQGYEDSSKQRRVRFLSG